LLRDLNSETGGDESAEDNVSEMAPAEQPAEAPVQPTEAAPAPQPQVEGRRTQLKVVREHLETLTADVWNFKRSSQASAKRLETKVESIRKDLGDYRRSRDISDHVKSSEASAKRLDKQVTALRNELAALKASIATESARTRARDEAALSRILSKVSSKPKKPAKTTRKR
jgi:hypothetical protein